MQLKREIPSELQKTAMHEAGHALVCLLRPYRIDEWFIQNLDYPAKKPRKFMRQRDSLLGSVNNKPSKKANNDSVYFLGGYAAEQMTRHEIQALMTSPQCMEIGLDIYETILQLRNLIIRLGREPNSWKISKILVTTFERTATLFQDEKFSTAIKTLGKYMLEKMEEKGHGINASMKQALQENGIGPDEMNAMRIQLSSIHVPRIAQEAYAIAQIEDVVSRVCHNKTRHYEI